MTPDFASTGGGFAPILRREIRAYLTSPLFYVLAGIVLAATSVMFIYLLYRFAYMCSQPKMYLPADFERNATKEVLTNSFFMIHFFLLFTIPILSMRLIAEERRSGTLELLVTNPVRDWGLVLGKYFGALAVIGAILILMMAYPLALQWLGGQPEWPVAISCFIGLLFIAAAYLSFGLFASSITESQVVAAVIGYIGLFMVYILGGLLGNSQNPLVRQAGEALGIERHFNSFTTGNLQMLDFAYFLLFSALFLFLTAQVLGMRRWRI